MPLYFYRVYLPEITIEYTHNPVVFYNEGGGGQEEQTEEKSAMSKRNNDV